SGHQAAPLRSVGRSPKRLMWGGRLWPRSDGEAVNPDLPLEARRLLMSGGRRSLAVGMRAGAGQLAAMGDQVLLADRLVLEPALEDLARTRRVAGRGREAGTRRVRGHAVPRHRPPGVVLRRGLGEPDVAGVPGELS